MVVTKGHTWWLQKVILLVTGLFKNVRPFITTGQLKD